MTCLIRAKTRFRLTPETLDRVLIAFSERLKDRVEAGYVFGSVGLGTFREESDIDLVLICNENPGPFLTRSLKFVDLFDIYPALDILVYTREEFEAQLGDSQIGFWKSLRHSLKQFV